MRLNAARLDTATFIINQIRTAGKVIPSPYRLHAKRPERQRVSSNGHIVANHCRPARQDVTWLLRTPHS
jgi:hypothetical protein